MIFSKIQAEELQLLLHSSVGSPVPKVRVWKLQLFYSHGLKVPTPMDYRSILGQGGGVHSQAPGTSEKHVLSRVSKHQHEFRRRL